MKKSKSIPAIMAVAIIAMAIMTTTVIVVSCKKDKQETTINHTGLTTQSFETIDEYLKAFKDELLLAKKGEVIISLEQAEQDLGNLLNYDFGDANHATNLVRNDTINIPVKLVDGKVDLSQLAVAYKAAQKEVISVFNIIDFPDKSVLSILCRIIQNNRDENAGDVQIILTTRGIDPFAIIQVGIDSTDNWRVGFGDGKCDGSHIGEDHATRLEELATYTYGSYTCNGRVYYSNVTNATFTSDEFPRTSPNDPYYNEGYRLWYDTYGNQTGFHCVDYQELYYYYTNFMSIIRNELMLPEDNRVISFECEVGCYVSINHPYMLFCFYKYGKPNCTFDDSIL